MSLRAIRWGLLALVGLGLVATLIVVSVADPPGSRRPGGDSDPVDAGTGVPPILGRAPGFSLVDRSGRTVTADELRGEIWVADFVFTRCGGSCPRLTSLLLRLGADVPGLRRVSITVDPEYDTPSVLADYARAYSIADPRWLFLTGSPEEVERVVVDGFKLPIVTEPPHEMAHSDEPILHSDRFVLVDRAGAIRGYYEAASTNEYRRLVRDIGALGGENPAVSETAETAVAPDACLREVVDLHDFLEAWFAATLPETDEAFARFESVLAPEFVLIDPSGLALDRGTVVDAVRGGYGRSAGAGLSIRIENATLRHLSASTCLVSYEEWQRDDASTTARLSTVLFGPRSAAPNGVEWLHLHETWLPAEVSSEGQGESP